MTAYKLIDLLTNPIQKPVWVTGKSGRVLKRVRLVPGRLYHDYVDDPVFCESIKNLTHDLTWTKALEATVKEKGIQYTLPKRTCTCQSQKIRIWCVEVIE